MAIKEVGQNASEISSKAVSETAPTNGQVLKYNSTSGEWEPTTVLDGVDDQSSSLDDCITILDAEVVINEDGDDQNFRVESDTKTHMLFVDAGTNQVGINTSASVNKSLSVVDSALIKGKALFTLTGTIDPAASTTVTGSGTAFLTEVSPGDQLVVSGETRTVRSVTNDTTLVLDSPFTDNSNDASPDCNPAAFTVLKDGGTVAFSVDGDETVQVGTCFKIQTEDDATVNQSARLFFKEGVTDNLYGFSQFYTGDANPVFAGTTFTAPANSFNIFRHNNAEAGVPVMTMERSTGDIGIGDDGSGGITVPNEKITVDGAVALKSQGSDPSTSEDYSKLFAKDLVGADCSLLLHCDTASFEDTGLNGLTTTVTGATCDTSGQKFGAGSMTLDGSNDYVTVAASSGFSWGTNHTVEAWVNFVDTADIVYMFHSFGSASTKGTYTFDKDNASESNNGTMKFGWDTGSGWNAVTLVYSSAFPTGWHHYAFVKEGSTWTGYLDGTSFATASDSTTLPANFGTTDLVIGRYQNSDSSYAYGKAKIDELRISQTAQYTGNFTPRDSAFPSTFSELYASDEQGNVTKISPHNREGEWEYYSRNTKTGRCVRINMESVVRDLGELTGKTYIQEEMLPIQPEQEQELEPYQRPPQEQEQEQELEPYQGPPEEPEQDGR